MKCQFCGNDAKLVSGLDIYPHREDLTYLWFYACKPCNAWVGTHLKTGEPLGTLANKKTRNARMRAHQWFDPIWKHKEMQRREAYFWLSRQLGIPFDDTHIGNFDIDMCDRVVNAVKAWRESNGT